MTSRTAIADTTNDPAFLYSAGIDASIAANRRVAIVLAIRLHVHESNGVRPRVAVRWMFGEQEALRRGGKLSATLKGMLIGSGIGAGVGVAVGLAMCDGARCCHTDYARGVLISSGISAGIGAAIGKLIDHSRRP